MSQSSRAQKPLFLEFAGSKKKILDHVSDSTFSPQFKQQLFTFLHLVSSGDLTVMDVDGAQMSETCSYQLQNVFRWWACPEKVTGTSRLFLSQNQSYHTPEAEAESLPIFEKHFPNGMDIKSVFQLAGNEDFQAYYTSYLRARRDAFAAQQEYLDAFLPAKIDPETLQRSTPYDYLLYVWRFGVNLGTLEDMTRPVTELLIDSTVSFRQVASQLQKNLRSGAERVSFRNGDDVLNYSLVFFTNFSTLGFDQDMQDKPNKRAAQYSARQICPFTTQQNNTMTNLLLGSIDHKPESKSAEYAQNTALTRAFLSAEGGAASHSTRVQLAESFNDQFFRTCQSHIENIPNTFEFYKDGAIFAGVYPHDCWITIPTLLFHQLQSNNLAANFELPKETDLELNAIENIYSVFGFLGENSWLKDVKKPPRNIKQLSKRTPYDPNSTVVYEGQCEQIKCTVQDFPRGFERTNKPNRADLSLLKSKLAEFTQLETDEERSNWLKAYWSDVQVQKLIDADIQWRMDNGLFKYYTAVYDVVSNNAKYTCVLDTNITIQTHRPPGNTKMNTSKFKFVLKKIMIVAVNDSICGGGEDDYESAIEQDSVPGQKHQNSSGFTLAKSAKKQKY